MVGHTPSVQFSIQPVDCQPATIWPQPELVSHSHYNGLHGPETGQLGSS